MIANLSCSSFRQVFSRNDEFGGLNRSKWSLQFLNRTQLKNGNKMAGAKKKAGPPDLTF